MIGDFLAPGECLTPQDETVLFGPPAIDNPEINGAEVLCDKERLAMAWLSQFWVDDIPEDFTESERMGREEFERINAKWIAEGLVDSDEQLLDTSPMHPVAHMLMVEFSDSVGLPLDERPILQTALYYAYIALEDDPIRTDRIDYALAIREEAERYLAALEIDPKINFPAVPGTANTAR